MITFILCCLVPAFILSAFICISAAAEALSK